jgi:hypothetical protein
MNEPTTAQFVAWLGTQAENVAAVLVAKAFAQAERARVDAYVTPFFASWEFRDDEGNVLTDPRLSYTSDDPRMEGDDAPYWVALDALHRQHGFKGPRNHCPALEAEEAQRQAEIRLLAAFGEFFGLGSQPWNTLEQRAEILRLVTSAALNGQPARRKAGAR